MKIKKGDTVKIIAGKDRGKDGKVLKVMPSNNKLIVDGLNLAKKHRKPKKQGEKGEVIQIPRPIFASNVMMVCPGCKQTTRIGCKILENDKKRICKKCGSEI